MQGLRASNDEIMELVDQACSTRICEPIVPQYFPGRRWLWRQWGGTIVKRVLPREVLLNVIIATVLTGFLSPSPGLPWATQRATVVR